METRPEKISVSRDALRADLAEMELRLRTWIGTELHGKASQASLMKVEVTLADLQHYVDVKVAWADSLMPLRDKLMAEHIEMRADVAKLIEGEFHPGTKRGLNEVITSNLDSRTDMGWQSKSRWISLASLLISLVVCIAVVVALFV